MRPIASLGLGLIAISLAACDTMVWTIAGPIAGLAVLTGFLFLSGVVVLITASQEK